LYFSQDDGADRREFSDTGSIQFSSISASIFECHLDPVQGSNIEVKRSWWNYSCAPKLSALAPVGFGLKYQWQ